MSGNCVAETMSLCVIDLALMLYKVKEPLTSIARPMSVLYPLVSRLERSLSRNLDPYPCLGSPFPRNWPTLPGIHASRSGFECDKYFISTACHYHQSFTEHSLHYETSLLWSTICTHHIHMAMMNSRALQKVNLMAARE